MDRTRELLLSNPASTVPRITEQTHTHTTSGEGDKDKGIMVRMDNAGVVLAELLYTNLSLRVTKINTEI